MTVQAPNDGATVTSDKPTIRAQFSGNVDPNTIRVALDGVDVTNQTTRYANGIVYAPSSPLQQMVHRVVVAATDSNGLRFRHAWTFTSGAGAAAAPVALTITAPANGSNVPGTFTVSGRTTPGAQIHLVAGGVATFGGIFQFNTGSTSGDTTADANGNFSHQLNLGAPSGSQIGLTVTSTNRGTGESQQKQLQLRAQ
ncbi:MAG: hypothetical protein GIW95_12340 [Candidatus Eremiobacteraeota bacterium]|nr:hypothetical protein [Candidatus Eremiobacteraeota bacterium]